MEAPSNNEQSQHWQTQSFGYALAMNLLWCWSHWCLEEESRMTSSVLESLFVLRISQYIGVFLETTDIKHLYFGTKWPWTLVSKTQGTVPCSLLGLPGRVLAPSPFCFGLLKRTKPRATESTAEHLDVVFLFFFYDELILMTKMIRRQKWLILMDVSRSCWTCSWPSLNFAILRLAQPVVVWTSTKLDTLGLIETKHSTIWNPGPGTQETTMSTLHL